jgi:hypothetical protein
MESLLSQNNFLNTACFIKTDSPIVDIDRTSIQLETKQIIAKIPIDNFKSPLFDPSLITSALVDQLIADTQQTLNSQYYLAGKQTDDLQLTSRLTDYQKLMKKIFKLDFPEWATTADELVNCLLNTRTPQVWSESLFCIVPPGLATILINHSSYVQDLGNTKAVHSQIHSIGSVASRLQIYVNGSLPWESTSVIVGIPTVNSESGTYLIEGKFELIETDAFAENGQYLNAAIVSKQAISQIGTDSNVRYISYDIINKKKPFFRKLFNL